MVLWLGGARVCVRFNRAKRQTRTQILSCWDNLICPSEEIIGERPDFGSGWDNKLSAPVTVSPRLCRSVARAYIPTLVYVRGAPQLRQLNPLNGDESLLRLVHIWSSRRRRQSGTYDGPGTDIEAPSQGRKDVGRSLEQSPGLTAATSVCCTGHDFLLLFVPLATIGEELVM